MQRWALGAWEVGRTVWPMIRIEFGLRTTDLPAICRRLGVALDLASEAPPASDVVVLPRRTRRVVLASLAVISHWPAGDTCLRRCLLIGYRLRELEPVLRIGVRRDRECGFQAHSWLEFGGGTLDPASSGFAPLGSAGSLS